jgi:hypothetical protein
VPWPVLAGVGKTETDHGRSTAPGVHSGQNYAGAAIGYGGGGGVFAYSRLPNTLYFTMHTGAITNNKTKFRGGGVFMNSADCEILGGEISNNSTTANDNAVSAGGGVYLHTYMAVPKFTMKDAVISGNHSRNGGGIARNDNSQINISGNSVISGNTAELIGGGIYSGQPAPGANPINGVSIGTGRNSLSTASTVRFERNRSQMPVSYGLSTAQVKANNTALYNSILWSGKNSANGVRGNDDDFHLFNNYDIWNLQGVPIDTNDDPELTTLAVSKTISGDFSNMYREFEFTVTFTDLDGNPLPNGTKFSYVGDNVANTDAIAPANGILTLDSGGSAAFSLGHGQVIIIEDVPLDGHIRVTETPYEGYTASYADSEGGNPVFANDTGLLLMTKDRVFSFNNERYVAPPTGIALDDARGIMILAMAVTLPALIIFTAGAFCRRRKEN